MSEQVKGIPGDLRLMYESSKLDSAMFVGSEIRELIGRIARSEQALAALEARNRELEKIVHAVQNSHPNCDKNYYVGNDTRIDNRCSLCAAIDAALKGAS